MSKETAINFKDNYIYVSKETWGDLISYGTHFIFNNVVASIKQVIAKDGYFMIIDDDGSSVYSRIDRISEFNEFVEETNIKRILSLLRRLHLDLEKQGNQGDDWRLARYLEDSIGSGQHSSGDLEKAKSLLDQHNY